MKRAHYLQHVAFEGLGAIEPWLIQNQYQVTQTAFYADGRLPDLKEIDLLIIMGGPMSVNDELIHPWLVQEKAFIRACIEAGKAILGICLGAQLIASASGAAIYPNPQKEIGWFPVYPVNQPMASDFQIDQSLNVFHWHGETFDLPEDAEWIASSEACLHQAFAIGQRILGLQFHIETTLESMQALISHCRDELIPCAYVQSESDLLKTPTENFTQIHAQLYKLLETIAN